MVSQARAEATRQAIVAAAVEVFEEIGYGNTSLSDIIERAQVTKGGFYYHFRTKEELAVAIIEQSNDALGAALRATLAAPAPMLENLIRVPFIGVEMMRQDRVVRMGYQLRLAQNLISATGQSVLAKRRAAVVSAVETAIAEGDLVAGLDAAAVGHTIWASLLGTQLLATAADDDITTRLAQMWRVILAGTAAPASLPYFTQFVARLESHHSHLA